MFNLKLSSIKTFNQIFQIEISQFTDASLKSVICVLTIERKLNMGIYFVQMQWKRYSSVESARKKHMIQTAFKDTRCYLHMIVKL